jgi:hypothetical protein
VVRRRGVQRRKRKAFYLAPISRQRPQIVSQPARFMPRLSQKVPLCYPVQKLGQGRTAESGEVDASSLQGHRRSSYVRQ